MDPAETWLQDEVDGTAYFPNDGGRFSIDASFPHVTLLVNFPLQQEIIYHHHHHVHHQPSAVLPWHFIFSPSNCPQVNRTYLKIVKAMMDRIGRNKPDFAPTSRMFIELSEDTANLEHIFEAVCTHWSSHYKIVTIDGIEVN